MTAEGHWSEGLMQQQEQLFARLRPESPFEEHLVRQIVVCRSKLDGIQNRLTKAWSQLNKISAELRHAPLP